MVLTVMIVAGVAAAVPLAGQSFADSAEQHSGVVLPSTQVRVLSSPTNRVEYKLYVSLPPGYDSVTTRFPVIYLLDADYSFPIAHAVTRHLTERGHLPPIILVGIAYGGPSQYRLNRTRDYTPHFHPRGGYGPEYQRVSGGGPQFLEFMQKQLLPLVEREYRATSHRTLVGHSYGGLFALWTALTEPGLFDHVLSVSPSLWYDDRFMFAFEARQKTAGGQLPERVYMTVGDLEADQMSTDLRQFARQLEDRKDGGTRLRAEVLENETHNSVFPSGFSRGLRWLFQEMGAR
jgi:predicted alpha/beta superfamily hydrolase